MTKLGCNRIQRVASIRARQRANFDQNAACIDEVCGQSTGGRRIGDISGMSGLQTSKGAMKNVAGTILGPHSCTRQPDGCIRSNVHASIDRIRFTRPSRGQSGRNENEREGEEKGADNAIACPNALRMRSSLHDLLKYVMH